MHQRKRLAVLAAFMLLAAACEEPAVSSTTPDPTPETSTSATTAAVSTTTVGPSTNSSDPTDGAVGSEVALVEAMEPVLLLSESLFNADISSVEIPEINIADPVSAVRELLLLDFWVFSNAPLEEWADILAVRGSPDWEAYLGAFDSLLFRTAEFQDGIDKRYDILEVRRATDRERRAIPIGVVRSAGAEAAFVVFRTSMAPHILVNADRPELDEPRDGWTDQTRLAIVVPTDLGWRFFWSESQ